MLLLKQLLGTIIKLFNFNVLVFQQTLEVAVREDPASDDKLLFLTNWYAWQDSNLRAVAPETTDGRLELESGANSASKYQLRFEMRIPCFVGK
jgi:hypothetical protein